MRKLSLLAILCLFGVSTVTTAWSQKKAVPGVKPGSGAPVAGTTKVTGPVKGAPAGKTFVIATPRKGPVTVDASGAQFRHRGKFASAGDLKAGAFVQAAGTMAGATLKATEVTILRLPGEKNNKKPLKGATGHGMKPVAPPSGGAPPSIKRP